MTTEQKSEQKDLPEWWDTFCEAFKTRTLDKYECNHLEWEADRLWDVAAIRATNLYDAPHYWRFRKRARTVNIDGVELVAPVLAGDVIPRDTIVWTDYGNGVLAEHLQLDVVVYLSKADSHAMRNALLGVKP